MELPAEKYDAIRELIEQNPDHVEFSEFGDGISEEWIQKAEARLGVKFPASYTWWLKNYSGGTVHGDEIFSVYGLDFDTVVGGDIVYMNELYRGEGSANEQQLILCTTDDGSVYFFDLSAGNEEYPVNDSATGRKYADHFLDFLEKMINR